MEIIEISDIIYKQILVVDTVILYLIALLCFVVKLPKSSSCEPYFKGYYLLGSAFIIWGTLLIPMLWDVWKPDWLMNMRVPILISAFYIFTQFIAASAVLLLSPKSKIHISAILLKWVLLTIILVLFEIIGDSRYITVSVYGVKFWAVMDVIAMLYKPIINYRRLRRNLGENYITIEEINIAWMRDALILFIIWLLIGFFINHTDKTSKALLHSYGIFVAMFSFISYTKYLRYLYNLHIEFETLDSNEPEGIPEFNASIKERNKIEELLNKWIEEKGYLTKIESIDEIAALIYTNKSYLSRYINRKYNCNFRTWIASLRLEYAKKLLKEDKTLTVAEVAETVQYTANSFSTIFKKHFGITISQWRNNIE